ncbi:hypothetical protein BGX23_007235 [Mortierella sp. AD031]|nr:hypothetical protein BGX23_007235 [Mortierella sp. AD031]
MATSAPKVLIVGAGLGGLFLGCLLEEAKVEYEIFERAAEIKPLGAVICLDSHIFPAMSQVGVYENIVQVSLPARRNDFYNERMELTADFINDELELTGYSRLLFARPVLYDLLFNKIPRHKIHLSKKLTTFDQDSDGVVVHFADGSSAKGDILVGTDGAHSGVRQHLYKTLDQQGFLPKVDTESMNKGYISLLGTTDPLDPAKHPQLNNPDCEISFVIGDNTTPYTWTMFTIPENKVCWNVVVQLELAPEEAEDAKNSDWSPASNQRLLERIRHFKTPYGTLGTIFDATPMDRISKVYFEDKLFKTWNHDRVVLIGDAAHKLLPSTGAGAVNAMQDAVVLSNYLYDIVNPSFENIKATLDEYREERFPYIESQYAASQFSAKLQFGHTWTERILRHVIFKWMPSSVMQKQIIQSSAYRPQANFLPQVPHRGSGAIISQKPSKRLLAEEAKKAAAASAL